jgi:hypothetical protein
MSTACTECPNPAGENFLTASDFLVTAHEGMVSVRAVINDGTVIAELQFCQHDATDVALRMESASELVRETS